MFITFEGLDYSGKTTQATLLVDHLKQIGKQVLFLREPGGTAVSEKIREILLDKKHPEMTQATELFLFSAARAQLVSEIIRPALDEGKVVICDRFYDSTTAYQGYGRGLDLQQVKGINMIAIDGVIPDLTLLIDIPTDEIIRRRNIAKMSADRMELSGNHFYDKVREGYHALAAEEAHRMILLDGMKPIQEIHEEILKIIHQQFKK